MVFETPVTFHSQGVPLAGRLPRNTPTFTDRQPAAMVMGSWLTVKEQMPALYARWLAGNQIDFHDQPARPRMTACDPAPAMVEQIERQASATW